MPHDLQLDCSNFMRIFIMFFFISIYSRPIYRPHSNICSRGKIKTHVFRNKLTVFIWMQLNWTKWAPIITINRCLPVQCESRLNRKNKNTCCATAVAFQLQSITRNKLHALSHTNITFTQRNAVLLTQTIAMRRTYTSNGTPIANCHRPLTFSIVNIYVFCVLIHMKSQNIN